VLMQYFLFFIISSPGVTAVTRKRGIFTIPIGVLGGLGTNWGGEPAHHGSIDAHQSNSDGIDSNQSDADGMDIRGVALRSTIMGRMCKRVAVIRWKQGVDPGIDKGMMEDIERWLQRRGVSIYTDLL
jgi:hypothetical protein